MWAGLYFCHCCWKDMTSFCAVSNDKVARPSHCGEGEAACADHYGHLNEENTPTESGKVGLSSRVSQCASGSGSNTKKEMLYFSHIVAKNVDAPRFLTVPRKTSGKGWRLSQLQRWTLDGFVFLDVWSFFILIRQEVSEWGWESVWPDWAVSSRCIGQQVWSTWSPGRNIKQKP